MSHTLDLEGGMLYTIHYGYNEFKIIKIIIKITIEIEGDNDIA